MSVAVVLTCRNEGAWIGRALASVLAQDAAAEIAEIVLADDGSDEETLAVLDGLEGADPRLRILRGPGGWGVSGARNRAAAATRAPLLAFLDGDDEWAPAKLARQLAALRADGSLGLVYTGYRALAAGAEEGEARAVYDLSRHARPARRYFLRDPPILPSSVLMRRSAFAAVGGFDEGLAVFEDTDLFLRLARVSRLKGLPEPLIRKRYRAGSLSAPRPELMAHHAYAAFAAGARDAELAPLVPRRLAERAARLGLVAYYAGDLAAAGRHGALARALRPLNLRAFALGALLAGGAPLRRALAGRLARRSALHGR
jgi:glycosyltransferase involved in cell wall biosynthesis